MTEGHRPCRAPSTPLPIACGWNARSNVRWRRLESKSTTALRKLACVGGISCLFDRNTILLRQSQRGKRCLNFFSEQQLPHWLLRWFPPPHRMYPAQSKSAFFTLCPAPWPFQRRPLKTQWKCSSNSKTLLAAFWAANWKPSSLTQRPTGRFSLKKHVSF